VRLANVAAPTNNTDAANKFYVDEVSALCDNITPRIWTKILSKNEISQATTFSINPPSQYAITKLGVYKVYAMFTLSTKSSNYAKFAEVVLSALINGNNTPIILYKTKVKLGEELMIPCYFEGFANYTQGSFTPSLTITPIGGSVYINPNTEDTEGKFTVQFIGYDILAIEGTM
jgi:hypothetical protein